MHRRRLTTAPSKCVFRRLKSSDDPPSGPGTSAPTRPNQSPLSLMIQRTCDGVCVWVGGCVYATKPLALIHVLTIQRTCGVWGVDVQHVWACTGKGKKKAKCTLSYFGDLKPSPGV
eukprot:358727-Chlamydomonas_euryale.AAC.17